MVVSMTGFARETISFTGKSCSIEIKSVNSKNLDLSCLLPGFLKFREMEIRKFLAKEMVRGKIECKISLDYSDEKNHISLNKPIIRQVYKELVTLGAELKWEENVKRCWELDQDLHIFISSSEVYGNSVNMPVSENNMESSDL